jgi:hypothetical protein
MVDADILMNMMIDQKNETFFSCLTINIAQDTAVLMLSP